MQDSRRFSRNRPSRGLGLRRTTGCIACRRRHVKCDEKRPRCGGCTRKEIQCMYASPQPGQANSARSLRRKAGVMTRNGSADSINDVNDTIDVPESSEGADGLSSNNNLDDNEGDEHVNVVVESNDGSFGANSDGRRDDSAFSVELRSRRTIDRYDTPNTVASDEAGQTTTVLRGEGQTHVLQENNETTNQDGFLPASNDGIGLDSAFSGQVRLNTSQAYAAGLEPGNYASIYNVVYEELSPSQLPPFSQTLPYNCTPDSRLEHGEMSPTSRWLNLLIADAALDTQITQDPDFKSNGLDIFGNSLGQIQRPLDVESQGSLDPETLPHARENGKGEELAPLPQRHPYLQERLKSGRNQHRDKEHQSWKAQEAILLQPQEHILFQHFVEHISQWMDLFDPQKPFATFLPHLALHNVGLMNAILALSARHLRIVNKDTPAYADGFYPNPNDTIKFYYKSLHYSQEAMQYDTFKTSLELLASAIIISSYEMLDGSSTDWEKHLKGVFWIQRSQTIHGDSSGLRQAVWWAWICQDTWAAFREKREPFTFWRPARGLADLNPAELAARAIYNFAQVVGYCARSQDHAGRRNVEDRTTEAELLVARMDAWKAHLTVEFEPLPLLTSAREASEPFAPLWIRPAAFAVSQMVYYCSLILLHLHQPFSGGMSEHFSRQRKLKTWASMVCGIAGTLKDDGSSVMSTQCVFIAGMVLEDEKQRSAVIRLLSGCRQRAGWPGYSLESELHQIWQEEHH